MDPGRPAGGFSDWLGDMRRALRSGSASDVPCDGCTACCASSQFVHIAPDETDTLARIPPELLFPAPRMPPGHVLLGYDRRGRCPMLTEEGCSIYEHRPRTCRVYDCRVLPAAGLRADDDKPLIAEQAERWQFSFPTEDDRAEHDAVRAAARFLREHQSALFTGALLPRPTQLAVLAVEVCDQFIARDVETGRVTIVAPEPHDVRAALDLGRPPGSA